jgi:hypothetical protein
MDVDQLVFRICFVLSWAFLVFCCIMALSLSCIPALVFQLCYGGSVYECVQPLLEVYYSGDVHAV